MYLTRKGAPVRLVYPFSTALTVGDFYFQPRSMTEVSFITSELKTQAQTQMRVRRESVPTNQRKHMKSKQPVLLVAVVARLVVVA